MASMLVVAGPGHSATGAWWSASAGDHPTGTLAVLTTDAGTRHLCSAETEARLRHADTCYNVTIIAFISLKQGAGVQSPEQEGGLVTSNCRYYV